MFPIYIFGLQIQIKFPKDIIVQETWSRESLRVKMNKGKKGVEIEGAKRLFQLPCRMECFVFIAKQA